MLSASANPTQKSSTPQPLAPTNLTVATTRPSLDRDGLQPPMPGNDGKSFTSSTMSFTPRGSSLNPSPAPGSFTADVRSQLSTQLSSSRAGSRLDVGSLDNKSEDDNGSQVDQTVQAFKETLNRELKIKEGSENLLEALNIKKAKQTKEQRQRVEAELNAANQRIRILKQKIADALRAKNVPATPTKTRNDGLLQNTTTVRSPQSAPRSVVGSEIEEAVEQSPTFALAEILQALEVEGLTPEYYVSRANLLVDLLKRHPTLKYDLVWSVFGDRMQVMLLSDSREVVAAGYRMIRYAISDVASLKKIRSLNTDYLVIVSLAKDRKADVEREQALKFIRTFLDVKGGVKEISRAVVRTVTSVAEQPEDRLRPICIETLAEILLRDPALVSACGGFAPVSEALSEGSYKSPESLASAYLYLLDSPFTRVYLRAGCELEVMFTAFTDTLLSDEVIVKQNSKAVAMALKSWSGLMTLSMYNFRAVRSLVSSLVLPNPAIRDTIIDLLFSLLRIKPPAWATPFLAGRRLTTYGRVTTLKATNGKGAAAYEEDGGEQNFVEHYTALLLAILLQSGMMPNLLQVAQDMENPTLKRKTTLLIGEILKLASRMLPQSMGTELYLLPELFSSAVEFREESRFNATGVVYQISSVSRTLYLSSPSGPGNIPSSSSMTQVEPVEDAHKSNALSRTDDATWRQLLLDTGVLGSSNPLKWNWDVILKVIEGPLTSGRRLDEAMKASKFMRRMMSFYRPFKCKFSAYKNTRNTQKYVRVGCALIHSLLQSTEGVKHLMDNKLLRQIAECLAQCDPTSGLTAQFPMFFRDNLTDTLCSGYFPMLGVLSGDPKGMQMLERCRIFNMSYHIIDAAQRPDLIKLLLTSFDYNLQGHPRVLLSKVLTAGTKEMRILATNVLRKHATRQQITPTGGIVSDSKWAIQLLVTQLYDPEIEVCATAVKILEKACNNKQLLEYIVQCRPGLDHLGEIGAPLLLRFLSTSIGYHYLDGLDYISNEMDDWFLGRNDVYVDLIEASLARSFIENPDDQPSRLSIYEDELDVDQEAHVPPHFYRELTRTKEGCRLLEEKGHFDEFASTIREYGMQVDDVEIMTKVKGCMWAVGNVGSMELGAPFLESTDVVEYIVKIAEKHEVMSLRGTAFFVLGLISRSTHGLEILSEHGWETNMTPLGTSLGFCLPRSLTRFLSFQPWNHKQVSMIELPSSQRTIQDVSSMETSDADESDRRILELLAEIGNLTGSKKAKMELMLLKRKKAPGFRHASMFRRVLSILETHHYRLGDRHMIIELFDKSVLRQVVYGFDGDDDANSSSGDEQRTERQRSISDPSEFDQTINGVQQSSI